MITGLRILPFALVACVGWPRVEAEPVPSLVLTHLDLEVKLDVDEATLQGTAKLTLRNTGGVPLRDVPLQLGRLMSATAAFGAQEEPIRFEQDVVVFDDWPTYQVDQLHLTLPVAIPPGSTTTVGLRYGGTLVGYTESGMLYVQDRIDHDFTILRSEGRAFPVVAVPSAAAMRRAPREDFTYELRVSVPMGLQVVAGTPPKVRGSNGFATHVFRGAPPVPFLNICIAPYREVSSENAHVFYFPADSLGARNVLSAIDRCLDLYAQWFGPLEEDTSLVVMEIPEGFGSQASLTAGIMQTADAFRDGKELVQLYHELAHLWHPRNLDVPSPRWEEGLAMFLQQRAAVVLDGAESLDTFMQRQADKLTQQLGESEMLRTTPMIDYGKQDVTGLSYRTGRLFFYVLYAALGADAFDQILGAYFRAHRDTGSTTKEFVEFVDSHTDVALQTLFQDWLFTTGWAERLEASEPLADLIASYRAP